MNGSILILKMKIGALEIDAIPSGRWFGRKKVDVPRLGN
jgi:hypothetical protein